jgi:hypothetical protein
MEHAIESLTQRQREKITQIRNLLVSDPSGVSKTLETSETTGGSPVVSRCMARIHDNTQCTRKYKDTTRQLCGSHLISLPYGRIDQPHTMPTKSKNTKKVNLEVKQDDLRFYLATQTITIGGIDYLIDKNGILFEISDSNRIVGHRLSGDQIEWF